VRRLLAAAVAVVIVPLAIYWFAFREKTVEAQVTVPQLAARIGDGAGAVPVAADGEVVDWSYRPQHLHLPALPLSEPPPSGRLRGTALEQVEVLGAAPAPLRRFLDSSRYGESGVEVELTSGIEIRFGDSSQAERKWKAAATVLADPSITSLDYVDVHSPSHPAVGGEGHLLPE